MERTEIVEQLTTVFRKTFDKPDLTLTDDLTASDVDNWDSLTHMMLIGDIEKEFDIKFKLKELNKMNTVGDLIGIVEGKTS
ncbi:MAG: acyl carrier protein [Pricia sp.]